MIPDPKLDPLMERLRTINPVVRTGPQIPVYESYDPNDALGGTIIGHWLVGPDRQSRKDKHRAVIRPCLSRCGVLCYYKPWEIQTGRLPTTCWACRGEDPAGRRVMGEKELNNIQPLWDYPVMSVTSSKVHLEEKSNLKGKVAVDEWYEFGKPMLCAVLAATELGAAFGWKAYVRDCHDHPEKKGKTTGHVNRIDESQRLMTLVLHPRGSRYTYDVDLRTVRTDGNYKEIAVAVQKALCEYVNPPQVAAAATPTPVPVPAPVPAPVPSTNGKHPVPPEVQVVNIDMLRDLRKNLDIAEEVGRSMNEIAAMKAEAQKKIDAAKVREQQLRANLLQLEERDSVKRALLSTITAKIEDYLRRAKNAEADADAVRDELDVITKELADAKAEYAPAEAELKSAVSDLKDAERLEAEQQKLVGKSQDVQLLLKLLAQVGK